MASLTAKTESVRQRKHRKAGAAAKAARRIHGSTPAFPIHKDKVKAKKD